MQRTLLKQRVILLFALLFVFTSFESIAQASELHDKACSSEEHEFLDLPSLYPGLSESARSSGAGAVISGGPRAGFRLTGDLSLAMNDLSGAVRVDDFGITGSNVDFKRDLGIDNESTARFGVLAHLLTLRIGFAFQDMSFSSTKVLERDIFYAGTLHTQGTELKTEVDNTYCRIEVGVTPFWSDPFKYRYKKIDLGFSLGAHFFDMTTLLAGPGVLAGTSAAVFHEEEREYSPFVLTLGTYLDIYPTDSIALESQIMLGFMPKMNGLQEALMEFSIQGEYYFHKIWALGLRLSYTQYMAKEDTADNAERFVSDFDLSTFQIGIVMSLSI